MKPTNGRRSHSEKGYIDSVLSTKRPRSICSGQLAPKFAVPCGLTGCVLIPWSHNLGHRTPVFSGWTLPYGDSNLWLVFSTSHALHHAQGLFLPLQRRAPRLRRMSNANFPTSLLHPTWITLSASFSLVLLIFILLLLHRTHFLFHTALVAVRATSSCFEMISRRATIIYFVTLHAEP